MKTRLNTVKPRISPKQKHSHNSRLVRIKYIHCKGLYLKVLEENCWCYLYLISEASLLRSSSKSCVIFHCRVYFESEPSWSKESNVRSLLMCIRIHLCERLYVTCHKNKFYHICFSSATYLNTETMVRRFDSRKWRNYFIKAYISPVVIFSLKLQPVARAGIATWAGTFGALTSGEANNLMLLNAAKDLLTNRICSINVST